MTTASMMKAVLARKAYLDARSPVVGGLFAEAADEMAEAIKALALEDSSRPPIPLILFCPICDARHIDEGSFASEPHKSHACQGCGFTWAPSNVPTVGVRFLPGYKNETT